MKDGKILEPVLYDA